MGLDTHFYFTRRKEIGYFRKAHFLRYFFEARCDAVNEYTMKITPRDALQLLDCCNKVLKDHDLAPLLLPDTEYGEGYFIKVKDVADFVGNTLLPYFDLVTDEDKSVEFYMSY